MKPLISNRFANSFYQKIGNGPVIVLAHGFAEDVQIWDKQVDFLQKNYTLILPDFNSVNTNEKMSMQLLADFIHEILIQENIDKIILLGHSMGGYITLSFAQKYEHQLVAFGLIHSTAFADDEAKIETRKKAIRIIENEGKELFLKSMVPNLYSKYSQQKFTTEIQTHLTNALKISSIQLVNYYQAMIERKDLTDVLKNATVPVLFIIGKEDSAIPYTQMLTQSTMPKVSNLELFENVGHSSMIEDSNRLNNSINNFTLYVLNSKKA